MDKEQIELLEEFVDLCRIRPAVLNMDELKFFRDWLLELGAKLPTEKSEPRESKTCCDHDEPMKEAADSDESDIEISSEGVIDCDAVECDQFMGDQSVEVTEEMEYAADEKRNEALTQFREGNYSESIKLFTEAIKINPTCAMLYAKRASCYVKMKCPNAAIKDCNKCFELNPDSALAYKWRGISFKLLGKWEESFSDLAQSLKLDYADDTLEIMKEVEIKAKIIREHKRKYERKREDKLLNDKRERIRRAQEAHEKAQKEHVPSRDFDDFGDAGLGGMSGLGDLMNDPEMVEDLKDPEVMAALSELMTNPASLMKHQSNPKIAKIMAKMQEKFSGAGAAHGGGGCCGGEGRHGASPMETEDPCCGAGACGGSSAKAAPSSKTNIADDLD